MNKNTNPLKKTPPIRINPDDNEYRIETRSGYYSPAERLGPYSFPERFNCTFRGARVYDRVEARRVLDRLRKRGITVYLLMTEGALSRA